MACKDEREMLQLELYSRDVEATATALCAVFDMTVIEAKAGWRHLRHPAMFDFMLFDPATSFDGESHWPGMPVGFCGVGIEIVVCTTEIHRRREVALRLGFDCCELRYPPWGSTEFLFRLPEGYLLRVKQPPNL